MNTFIKELITGYLIILNLGFLNLWVVCKIIIAMAQISLWKEKS